MQSQEEENLFYKINNDSVPNLSNKQIHELFEEQVNKNPCKIAIVQDETQITYKELNEQASTIANYLNYQLENKSSENIVAFIGEQSINMFISILGILKAGYAFLMVDPTLPIERQKYMISESSVNIIISTKSHVSRLNRLQWECKCVKKYLCIDSINVHQEKEENSNELMDKSLWDYVGEKATDSIGRGGWENSYTGELFSEDEIRECSENVFEKLKPYINKNTKILEIGCSSGITMFKIAPFVKSYYGTDLSEVILKETKKEAEKGGHTNILLKTLAAHEIDLLGENDFDIIIFNSVVQAFNGHNYLRQVLEKSAKLIKETGIIFIGDIMNQDSKSDLIKSLTKFKEENKNNKYITKTDFSNELFLSPNFFHDLLIEQKYLRNCIISQKLNSIKNELTEYRYDIIIEVDKKKNNIKSNRGKSKEQHGILDMQRYKGTKVLRNIQLNNLAYIIFTSGTTGSPKGVLIEQKSLVNMVNWYNSFHLVTSLDKCAKFANCGFDASIMEIFPPLIAGSTIHILNNQTKSDLHKLNQYFEEHKITICFLPTQYCEQFMELENHSLRLLNTGGERLKKYIKKNYILANNYGPAECTVVSSCQLVDEQVPNIPVGKPISSTRMYILDKDKKILPLGSAGDLYIAGENIARGYLNNPELTKEKFISDPYFEGERMYCTGDIAFLSEDGDFHILGRSDEQVKIRGYRIELGEIESSLAEHKNIKQCAVITHESPSGEDVLCAYIVVNRDIPIANIKKYLAKQLPSYMIPDHFIILETMPITINGKIDKAALIPPEEFYYKNDNFVEPKSEIQKKIAKIWEDILGISKIGINDNFFELGGHSLKVLKVAVEINKSFDVALSATTLFKAKTIKEQSRLINESKTQKYMPIQVADKKDYYPASSSQKRIFTIQQMDKGNTAYNMLFLFSIKGDINYSKFKRAVELVVEKYEILITDFHLVNNKVMQQIHEDVKVEIELEYNDSEIINEEKVIKEFIKPMDLSHAPLFRMKLIKSKVEEYLLMVDIHHIVMDGSSTEIFWEEISKAYNYGEIQGPKIQFKDYTEFQQSAEYQNKLKLIGEYFTEMFKGELPRLNLPTDYERPEVQSFDGDVYSFNLDIDTTSKLNRIQKKYDVSMNMLLMAIYNVLLTKYSGQDDIIIGMPEYGRTHSELKGVMGMFVNTLVLRSQPKKRKTFYDYLKEEKEILLQGIDHKEYPFEELVTKLKVVRDISRNPIFDTMFVMQKFQIDNLKLNSLEVNGISPKLKQSKFDLTWYAEENENSIHIDIEYVTKIFKAETIIRMAESYKTIINQITENMDVLIGDIEILTISEKEKILYDFNTTKQYSNSNKTIQQIFREVVEINGENKALTFGSSTMTYNELDKRSNQVANYLRKNGVCRESVVGVYVSRSFEMIISILGILKAGAAYVTTSIEYPKNYLNEILEDSNAEIVLYHLKDKGIEIGVDTEKFKCIDINNSLITCEDDSTLEVINDISDMMYVVYTSGTSGKPKGIIVENRTMVNLISYMQNDTNIDFSSILEFASITFDVSFQEIFSCLLSGGNLLIVSETERNSIATVFDKIEEGQIKTLYLPPALVEFIFNEKEYIDSFPRCVKHIICAGEQLFIPENLREYISGNNVFLHNHYGPSETHVVTTLTIKPSGAIPYKPTIGKPICNSSIYILNEDNKLLPIGVTGELCVGGENIGRGYINQPELTKEKFQVDSIKRDHRLYHTGDLARWLPDGTIEYLGRMDQQLKIRGYRVEPSEIEKVMLEYKGVKQAFVTSFEDKKNNYLCVYFTSNKKIKTRDLRSFLLKQLPNYLVPNYFINVDKLPLNINGKVDKQALPIPIIRGNRKLNSKEDNDNERPIDEIEEKLEVIWKEVLGLSNIGVDDNFFELGGQSLKSIILVQKIKKEFNIDVLGSIVFKYSTIKEMARFMSNNSKDNKFSYLVEISNNGGNKNIFCVHPAPGTVICYKELSQYLNKDWSIYALQSKGLEKGQPPHETVEEMAAEYIKAIKEKQPSGPYCLLGWSVGGRIAYEIMQQLKRSGDEIKILFMLDTDPKFIMKGKGNIASLYMYPYAIFAMLTHSKVILGNLNITSFGFNNLFRRMIMWVKMIRAVYIYRPIEYKGNGRVILLQTQEGEKIECGLKNKSRSIKSYIKDLEVIPVGGKHLDMLSRPNVEEICDIINIYIE